MNFNKIYIILPILYFIISVHNSCMANNIGENQRQQLSIDSILALESFGNASFSGNGKWFIYEKIKAPKDFIKPLSPYLVRSSVFRELFLANIDTNDIISIDAGSGRSTWAGPWSPDGNKFIVYSANIEKGTFNIGYYNIQTKSYTELPLAPARPVLAVQGNTHQALWLDSNTVVYPAIKKGMVPPLFSGGDNKDHMRSLIEKFSEGNNKSKFYEEYESDRKGILKYDSSQSIIKVDIDTGRYKHLSDGLVLGLALSPDSNYIIAKIRTSNFFTPLPDAKLGTGRHGGYLVHELVLIDIKAERQTLSLSSGLDIHDALPINWSNNGAKIAFYAFRPGAPWETAVPYVYDLGSRTRKKLDTSGISTVRPRDATDSGEGAAEIFFSGDKPVLIAPRTSRIRKNDLVTISGSSRWFEVPMNVWELSSKDPPKALMVEDLVVNNVCVNRGSLRFQSANDHFIINSKQLKIEKGEGLLSEGVLLPNRCSISAARGDTIEINREYSFKNLGVPGRKESSNHKSNFKYNERLIDVAPITGYYLTTSSDNGSSKMSLVSPNGQNRRDVVKINSWLAQTETASFRKIDYKIPGDKSNRLYTAWYLLPVNYRLGVRYPTVLEIYPGRVLSEGSPPITVQQNLSGYQPYLAAEMGIVTLFASIPLDPYEKGFDMPRQLAAGAMAAINALVEAGIADKDRLAIDGASGGGYAAAAVLTQTQIFKAAILSAGFYNLTSWYGVFLPHETEDSYVHLAGYAPSYLEGGFFFMGAPPWKAPARYIKNSPLFFADRINTPMLFLHGEHDYVPVNQAEEMFSALVRQGKKAKFIRYWGEMHVFQDPDTIRHSWAEIANWLRDNLKISKES